MFKFQPRKLESRSIIAKLREEEKQKIHNEILKSKEKLNFQLHTLVKRNEFELDIGCDLLKYFFNTGDISFLGKRFGPSTMDYFHYNHSVEKLVVTTDHDKSIFFIMNFRFNDPNDIRRLFTRLKYCYGSVFQIQGLNNGFDFLSYQELEKSLEIK